MTLAAFTDDQLDAHRRWAMAVEAATGEAGWPCHIRLEGYSYSWTACQPADAEHERRFYVALHRAIALCEPLRPPTLELSARAQGVVDGSWPVIP